MRPKIKEIVTPIIRHGHLLRIGYEGKVYDLSDNDSTLEQLLLSLDGKNTLTDLSEIHKMTENEIYELLSQLDNISILEDKDMDESLLNDYEKSRYRANFTYFENYSSLQKSSYELQNKLKNTHVLVLGLGGAIQDVASLASLGIGKITGLDFDTIENSNLNRQYIYKESDVGESKAQAAQRRIKEINSQTEMRVVERKINSVTDLEDILDGVDIVISGIDSPGIISSRWVNFACLKRHIPVIFSGISGNKIMINKLSSDGLGCFDCFLIDCLRKDPFFEHQLKKLYGTNFEKKNTAIAPTVSILSGFITLEVMKLALNIEEQMKPGTMYQIDLNTLLISNDFSWERSPYCPTCSNKEDSNNICDIKELFQLSEV